MLDKRLLKEAKSIIGYLAGVFGLGLFLALLAVLQAKVVARVVSGVFLQGERLSRMIPYFKWLALIIVVRAVGQSVSEFLAHEGAARVKSALRQHLLRRMYARGPLMLRGERGGEVLHTLMDGIESLEDYFARYLPQLLLAVGIPVLVLGFVFPSDWASGMILLLTAPLIPLFMILIGKLAQSKAERQWREMSRMGAHFLDVLRGLATLKAFGRSRSQIRVISRVSDGFRQATLQVLRVAFLSAFVLELAATISTALVAVALGLRLVEGQIDFQRAFFVLLLAPEVYQPLRNLGVQFHASLTGKSAADRIYAFLAATEKEETGAAGLDDGDIDDGVADLGGLDDGVADVGGFDDGGAEKQFEKRGDVVSPKGSELCLQKVSYTYPGRSEMILNRVSLEVKSGETVLLVGESGAGKTTLAELLLGFLQPQGGQIWHNGVSIKDRSSKAWLATIAYVPQHPYLFYGTVLENLLLGRPDASREEVEQVAIWAGAQEFIRALPKGYETMIGEAGVRLSGGQAQRLALARALLKQASLLILDEPVSGLDRESEEILFAGLQQWRQGRTVLLISHRKSTWAWADRVLRLERGRIKEVPLEQVPLERVPLEQPERVLKGESLKYAKGTLDVNENGLIGPFVGGGGQE